MFMPSTRKLVLLLLTFFVVGVGQIRSQVRLSPEDAGKLAVEKPEPAYPAVARMLKLQETVQVEIAVSEAGLVVSATMTKGSAAFKVAAQETAKRWKYKPHLIDGKPAPFVTTIDIAFSLGVPQDEYERDRAVGDKYFKASDKCNGLVRGQKWEEAEAACKVAVELASQFPSGRELEKSGAYQFFGHVLRGQKRYREALEYYHRALDAVRAKLTEKNAELAQLYGDVAITQHLLRDLDKAREFYRKAENVYRLAHANILSDGDPDEETIKMTQGYMRALRRLLEYHLIAAEDAGAATEVEEIKKSLKSFPEASSTPTRK